MVKCIHSEYCGGCQNLDLDYHLLLENKTNHIESLFNKYNSVEIKDTIGNYYPLKYRNKIHLSFKEVKGKTFIGFLEEGSNKVVDVNTCLLFGDWAIKLISTMREYVSRFKIKPYDKFTNQGIIRYVHARCIDENLQITLVVSDENFGGKKWLLDKLEQMFKSVSMYININRRTDNAIFDKHFKFIGGEKYLSFNFCGVKVSISPSSFLQVNLSIAEKMYKKAQELLDIKPTTTVIDLYSGIGITSIMFSKVCKHVYAIEETPSSVENAKYMARLNNTKNITYFQGKCEDLIDRINIICDDVVVFVDPARAGMDNSVINTILKFNPRKIMYMSCNPETCVRDIDKLLIDKKYILNDIISYDMFPYTKHVEILTCLHKKP